MSGGGASEQAQASFNTQLIIGIIIAAITAFIAFLFLSTYLPEMSEAGNGGAHALSKSAIGYAGIIKLLEESGTPTTLVSDDAGLKTPGLLIVAPPPTADPAELAKLIMARNGAPTLIVLPKYAELPDVNHRGWAADAGLIETGQLARLLSAVRAVTFKRVHVITTAHIPPIPGALTLFPPNFISQTVRGAGLTPYLTDDLHPGADLRDNDLLLAAVGENTFILAEPDLINNLGIADPHRAFAALYFLRQLSPHETPQISFDVTLNGFGHGRSLLDLALRPPFLAMTLALLIAALLALLNGLMRFGPALSEPRAIPRGKGALVANTADLIHLANAERGLGGRYATLIRDLAAMEQGLAPSMSVEAQNARLDALRGKSQRYSTLAAQAEEARDTMTMVVAAEALNDWRKER